MKGVNFAIKIKPQKKQTIQFDIREKKSCGKY